MGDQHGNNTIDPGGVLMPPPDAPMEVARALMPEFSRNGELTIRHWRGGWMWWRRTHWIEVEDGHVRSALYQRLEKATYPVGKKVAPWNPNRMKIANLIEALAAIAHTNGNIDAPAWVHRPRDDPPPAGPIVAVRNGLLDVPTRTLVPHDPRFLNLVSVPFDHDAAAPAPTGWLRFLKELWADDSGSIAALQEWFGYVLSGRTDLHKIFLIVGPTRSGKGTIARVLAAMIGRAHVAGPTLASLGTNFGLSPMLGKPLAVISDARLAGRDTHQVVERLLTISGEDMITVDRKYREPWTGRLPTRLMILSNELPNLGDASGTIAHRFIAVTMTESFLGKENPKLTDELITELPGILNWALDGLQRLDERGYFTEPKSTVDAIMTMKDSASPTSAFVRDECEVGSAFEIDVDDLYAHWREWSERNGRKPSNVQSFGRTLRSVVPGLTVSQPRDAGGRHRVYNGIRIRGTHNGSGRVPSSAASTERAGTHSDPVLHQPTERAGTHTDPLWVPLGNVAQCEVCGESMDVVEDGQTTHPNCEGAS